MWLETLGASKNRWLSALMFVDPLQLKRATVVNRTWARGLVGRTVRVGRVSDEWLRQFDLESHKRQDQAE